MSSARAQGFYSTFMNVLLVWALLLTVRLTISFLGGLSTHYVMKSYLAWTAYMVVPFGVRSVQTPYGGMFLADTALTVIVLVAAELLVSRLRKRA
ncbi:MAG: hypothetical protein HGA39_01185 [Coriobacteriia bacterium]|nr:hypothetical protein [Coriobacteriia bacterium]